MRIHAIILYFVWILLIVITPTFAQESKPSGGSAVTLAKDGTLIVDGKRTTVYGTFRDPSDDWRRFDGVRAAGFNLTHSYHFANKYPRISRPEVQEQYIRDAREYLDLAHKAGVGVFMHLPSHAVNTGNAEAVMNIVNALKDKPALWLWYLYDEPKPEDVAHCEAIYKRIKEADPNHPVLVVHHTEDSMKTIGNLCDVIGIDKYSFPYGFHYITQLIDQAKTNFPDKAIWLIQGAHTGSTIHLVRRHFNADCKVTVRRLKMNSAMHRPSPKELRAMFNYSLAMDSPGMIFYWLPKRYYDLRKDCPEIWDAITDIGKEFRELKTTLDSPERCKNITASSFVVEWSDAKPDTRIWTRKYDGSTYVGIVNSSYVPQVLVTLNLPDGWEKIYEYPSRRLVLDATLPKDQQYNSAASSVLIADWNQNNLYVVMNECDSMVYEIKPGKKTIRSTKEE